MGHKIAGVVCGRKFCSRCKKWRHAFDFHVRAWWDDPVCEYPRSLTSLCKTCSTVVNRIKNGSKPLVRTGTWRAKPGDPAYARRLQMNRASAARRREDPEYRKKQRSEQRRWRARRAAKAGRVFHPRPTEEYHQEVIDEGWDYNPMVNSAPFLEWWGTLNGERDSLPLNLRYRAYNATRNGLIRLLTIGDICLAVGKNELASDLMDACEAATEGLD